MKIGVTYPRSVSLDAARRFVARADRLRYDTVWVPESYGFDSFTILSDLAARTSSIKLATGIVNVYSRSPALIAQSIAGLDALSGGRAVLGLGTSGPKVIAGWHGSEFGHGLRRLRESVEIVRLILRRERLSYHGEAFTIDGGIRLMREPVRARVPIFLGSITPAGSRLAGEIADGWLPTFVAPTKMSRVLVPSLNAGARRRSPELGECDICAFGMSVVVCDDLDAGRDAVRKRLALYVGGMGSHKSNYYNDLFVRYGYVEEANRIQRLFLSGDRVGAERSVTDEMIDATSIIGSPTECREQLLELAATGLASVALTIETVTSDMEGELSSSLEALAPPP